MAEARASGVRRPACVGATALLADCAHAAPVGGADYVTAALSLALILGGFVAVAWLVRRWLPGVGGQGAIRVVGSAAVGSRERVVVVEVADTWLVVGVGGGQVRALHTLARPVAGAATVPPDAAKAENET